MFVSEKCVCVSKLCHICCMAQYHNPYGTNWDWELSALEETIENRQHWEGNYVFSALNYKKNTKIQKTHRYTKVHISLSLMHQLSIVITVREGERISQKAVSNLFFMIPRKICPNQFYKKRTYMNIAVDLVKSPVSF